MIRTFKVRIDDPLSKNDSVAKRSLELLLQEALPEEVKLLNVENFKDDIVHLKLSISYKGERFAYAGSHIEALSNIIKAELKSFEVLSITEDDTPGEV